MLKKSLMWGSIHGLMSVALGAFGAHGLKKILDGEALIWVETGARYQMYGALALLGLAALSERLKGREAAWAALGLNLGTAIFSLSLYLMAFTGMRWLGAVTPLGGLLILAGWLMILLAATKAQKKGPKS